MEIGKIIAIGLVGTIFAVLLKKENPQLALIVLKSWTSQKL